MLDLGAIIYTESVVSAWGPQHRSKTRATQSMTPGNKKYTAQTCETHARERVAPQGYLLISLAWAHWPQDARHPRTMCANARRRNGVPSETAAVLVFVKGPQLEVQFVSLNRSQDWAAQHNLPFAGGAAPTNVVQQNLSLPKLSEANATTSAINI